MSNKFEFTMQYMYNNFSSFPKTKTQNYVTLIRKNAVSQTNI